jgi:cyclophilin family peptidyl-prolyl cis-trans isomerase
VIEGFMAQTGDVKHGNTKKGFNAAMVGTGGSDLPDLTQEFNNIPHERGTMSMARSQDPNSANSQFFICFDKAPHLDRQYTAFGKVLEGMEFIDKLKKGAPGSGSVTNPDIIVKITVL